MTHPATLRREPGHVPSDLGTVACPECGRLAYVIDRFTLASTDGPAEHFRLRCDGGRHHLTLLLEGN